MPVSTYAPRTLQIRATRSVNRDLAQRLNPNVAAAGPLASITGNAPILRAGPLATGAGANPFSQNEHLTSLAQQLLNPTLTGEQQNIARATSRGAAARGLVGGAVNAAVTNQRNSFIAGNRIEALQGLSGGIEQRVGQLSSALNPFYGLVGGSITDLINQPGGATDYGKLRRAIAQRNLNTDVSGSVFTGLNALGRGDIVQGALASQLGLQGGVANLANTEENAQLLGALQQFLDPHLSKAQKLDKASAAVYPTRDFERGVNQLLAGSRLAQFFTEQLGNINTQYQDFSQAALGLSGFQGETAISRNARIANTDFSQFQQLFQSTGILPPGGAPAASTQVGRQGTSDFLQRAAAARETFAGPSRQIGVGGRIPRGNTRLRIQVI